MRNRAFLLSGAAFALVGCAVGPDYVAPAAISPAQLTSLADAPEFNANPTQALWWESFGDPTLNALVEDALVNNADLEAAAARIEQARALRSAAAGGGLPNLSASGSATRSQSSANAIDFSGLSGGGGAGDLGGIGNPQNIVNVGGSASWEIDLFGRIARRVEAADARLSVAEEDRNGVLLTVIADTVQNYAELRGGQQQVAAALENVAVARETLRLIELRLSKGLASDLDASRAAAELRTAEAQLLPLRAQVRSNNAALAALTGQLAPEFDQLLEASSTLALPDDPLGTGLPSELLRRRPDVRLAERRLAAETADIGAEIADLYPSFSLTGLIGFSSTTLSTLFSGGSENTSIGATLNWPIFSGGRQRAEVAEARAGADEARALYRGAVLGAFRDVDRALTGYAFARQELIAQEAALAERQKGFDLAKLRFETGLDSELVLLDVQRQLIGARAETARSNVDALVAVVGAYRALGGGWEEALAAGT